MRTKRNFTIPYTGFKKHLNKIKKKDGDMSISLTRTKDIIGTLGASKRDGMFLCGF
mgnify:CR=1 FL=1